jgi:DNA-binding CsgD family transcriptional regulator
MPQAGAVGPTPRPLGIVLEELLDHAGDAPATPTPKREVGEMKQVLEAEHDGARYLLLRGEPAAARDDAVPLSSRELEIARMIARGHTNRTVAAVLEISPWTVATHLRRIFAKLDVGSRAAMVARLVGQGVVEDDGAPDARRYPH